MNHTNLLSEEEAYTLLSQPETNEYICYLDAEFLCTIVQLYRK